MRIGRWLVVIALVACGNETRQREGTEAGSTATDQLASEQARFERERKPELLVKALAIGPGSRVADIGAGSGMLTMYLARAVSPGGTVVATDVDEEVLQKQMQPRLKAAGLADHVVARVVAADMPGLEPGAYDAILVAEVDHYFSDPVAWLKAAAAALKPQGRLVISNRIHHRQKSMAAAQKSGLSLVQESAPVPSHFIAVFVAPATLAKP